MPSGEKTGKAAAPKPAARRRRAYLPAAERRQSIIAAAQQVFARTNLQGARTRDIAAAAEINQATIFEHFESKEALFEAAVIQPLIDAMRGMHQRMEDYQTAGSPEEIAKLAHDPAERNLEAMLQLFPLLTTALFSDLELGRRLYRDHVAPLIGQRGEVLKPILREGIDARFVGLANFGMMFAIAMDRLLGEDGNGDLSELATQMTRLSTGGFARDKRK